MRRGSNVELGSLRTGKPAVTTGRCNCSLVICDESRHTKFPFSFAILSWGMLWLICPELSLILP